MDTCSISQERRACNQCGAIVAPTVTVLESGPHYAEKRCPECSKFFGFLPKPKNEDKRPKNKHTAKSLGFDYCQMCLRHVERLGSHGVLQVHHIKEIHDGGEDIPENIWVVCTSCHKLIHHQRTYLNNHFKGVYTIADLEKDMEHDHVPENVKERLRLLFAKNRSNNNA